MLKMKLNFLASLLLIPALSYASDAPKVYDITALNAHNNGQISLLAGKTLHFSHAIPSHGKIIFKDLQPKANWAHPASYELIAQDGTVIETIKAKFPPKELKSAVLISGEPNGIHLVTNADFNLNTFGGALKVKDKSHYFAVLINGAGSERHWNDMSFLYRVLTQIYGYDPKNIFVADSDYIKTNPDLDGDGVPDIQYESTIAGINAMMTKVASVVTSNDQLIVAIDDHGDSDGTTSSIVLADGEMPAPDFAKLLTAIPASRVLSIYEPCYSGGLVRPSVSDSRASMSAATNSELSWGSKDGMWDTFIFRVISRFARQMPDSTPLPNLNPKDLTVNAKQAFGYAILADHSSESPLMEDMPDTGFSATIGLGF